MVEYTHEVFLIREKGQPTTHYYHAPSKSVYNFNNILVNDDWRSDGKYWDVREIHFVLENK